MTTFYIIAHTPEGDIYSWTRKAPDGATALDQVQFGNGRVRFTVDTVSTDSKLPRFTAHFAYPPEY